MKSLLPDKDLFGRKVRDPGDQREHKLQMALVQLINLQCRRKDVTFYHPANGEQRDDRTGAKLKAMGLLPGVSDLMIYFGHEVLALELKARGRKLTEDQKWFGERMRDVHGHHFAWTDDWDEARAILQHHGVLP